jgi:hypothetical protein
MQKIFWKSDDELVTKFLEVATKNRKYQFCDLQNIDCTSNLNYKISYKLYKILKRNSSRNSFEDIIQRSLKSKNIYTKELDKLCDFVEENEIELLKKCILIEIEVTVETLKERFKKEDSNSKTETDSKTEFEKESETDSNSKTDFEKESEIDSNSKTEAGFEKESETDSSSKTETGFEKESETDSSSKTEAGFEKEPEFISKADEVDSGFDYFFSREKKPEEVESRKNEDFCKVEGRDGNIVFALSDGAGGSGLFSAEWSEALVEHFIEEFPEDLNVLLDSFWEDFVKFYKFEIDDNFKRTKFQKEGSSATLVGGKIENGNLEAISYGDSLLFHFDKEWNLKKMLPEMNLIDFQKNPELINWKHSLKEEFVKRYSAKVETGEKIVLVSDALSVMITALSQNGDILETGKISKTVEKLRSSDMTLQKAISKLRENFSKSVMEFYKSGYLLRDDYSMILIEVK